MNRPMRSVIGLLAALTLFAAACGDDDSDSQSTSTTGPAATTPATTKPPVTGGTLTFGSYSKISGLDPIVGLGHGTSGGIPMQAVFDALMRYNNATKQYDPQTAASLTANATSTEWTLKLKPNIKFHDGTDYDADAVKFGINRHRVGGGIPPAQCAEHVACPRNVTSSANYVSLIKDIAVVDKLTLRFTTEPWTSFPYLLSSEAGFIPSPTALKKLCVDPTKAINTCEFNLKAVGAGPFMVESYKPDDVITLVRNPTYWNGPVYLDGIRFLDSGDSGGLKSLEALQAGTTQAAFLRDAAAVADAKAAKIPGFTTPNMGGSILFMNIAATVNCVGGAPAPLCTGKPDGPTPSQPNTKDLKVRQAVVAAIDPQVVNQRAYGGKAKASSAWFTSEFPWDPKVPGAKFDPEAAKKLVTEAKAAGWNGTVRLLFVNTQVSRDMGLAVQTMLQTVGINAPMEVKEATAQQQTVISTKDFDLTTWGIATGVDDATLFSLVQNLKSDVSSNRIGFKSAIVDQALTDIRVSKTDAEKTAAYKKIAEEVGAQLPWVNLAQIDEYSAVSAKVQGATFGGRGYIFFDKAWLER
ncbi:MAG TPA: ABC transporter substrate-binding protein [Acidimicrobiales bacterium]|nr:ABC transporter substrate-binding protein [Acidimicrobiales bacterium]